MMGWHGASDGLVEIWNGMPFFSPVWARRPTVDVAAPRARHDVGDDAAAARSRGSAARSSSASRRRSTGGHRSSRSRSRRSGSSSTASASRPQRMHVVPPGVDRALLARRRRSPTPLVVAVGRLVPVKRFHAAHRGAGGVSRPPPDCSARSSSARATTRATGVAAQPVGCATTGSTLPGLARRTTSCSRCTAARGSSRARPPTKAGA